MTLSQPSKKDLKSLTDLSHLVVQQDFCQCSNLGSFTSLMSETTVWKVFIVQSPPVSLSVGLPVTPPVTPPPGKFSSKSFSLEEIATPCADFVLFF